MSGVIGKEDVTKASERDNAELQRQLLLDNGQSNWIDQTPLVESDSSEFDSRALDNVSLVEHTPDISLEAPVENPQGLVKSWAAKLSKRLAVLPSKAAVDDHLPGRGVVGAAAVFVTQSIKQPQTFLSHSIRFTNEAINILRNESDIQPKKGDKRFRHHLWKDNTYYRSALQFYLAWDKELASWVEELELEDADARRCRFLYEQLSAAFAPSNSLLNPAAINRAVQTKGASAISGLKNFKKDLIHNHGMPVQIRENAFKVGETIASSNGAVVHRSDVLELIQYKMEEGQVVHKRPVLIVPPQLNKFYIFDLSPKNSVVKHLQGQGVQPFIISWRTPSKVHADWDLDRYVSELETALEVMCEISGCDQVNLTSACAGGLTSMALLGYLAAIKKPLVHSHSLFVTALEADDSSVLGMFATRNTVELSRKFVQNKGYMDGKQLSHIFNWIRPTDLVWNYWVNNYLMGKQPPSMDVLFWDNDSTRLPAGLHSDFLDIIVENSFSSPGRLVVKGQKVDLTKIAMDFYCVAGDEDYLMPWEKCFEVPSLLNTHCTFVLSTSGHVQSILRPPGIANTTYYTNDDKTQSFDAETWLETASEQNGSWWEHWHKWLGEHSGEPRRAPQRLGSRRHPPLCPAPGLYVCEKVD